MTTTGMGRTWVYARLQDLAVDARVTQVSRGRWTVTDRKRPGERSSARTSASPHAHTRRRARRTDVRADVRRSSARTPDPRKILRSTYDVWLTTHLH